jgi:hypothetical protein
VITIEKSEVMKLINNRIKYWSQPTPENMQVCPEEMKIKTERMFMFCSRMIIEELKFIKKNIED